MYSRRDLRHQSVAQSNSTLALGAQLLTLNSRALPPPFKTSLRRGFLSVLLAGLLAVVGCSPSNELPQSGQWRIINYWALWCTPCREEIPELNALNSYSDITVLGVNYDRKTGAELEQHRAKLNIDFPSLERDPSETLGTARPQVLPTTLVVDPRGQLVATLVGPQSEQNLLDVLAKAGR